MHVPYKGGAPALTDTPTLAESGLPDYDVVEWNGVFLPKGTPPEIVQKLGKAVQAAVNDPAVRQKLLQLGLEPAGTTPEAFSKFVQDESRRESALVKARNIRVD